MGPLSTPTRRAFVRRFSRLCSSAAVLALLNGCVFLPSGRPPTRVPRVGYVGDRADEPWPPALWDELRQLGWVEGQTFTVERRDTAGATRSDIEVAAVVAELISLPVDVLVVVGTPAALAARQSTDTIPIVFTSVGDPVGVGLVTSLARPGANLTGVSINASTQLDAKQLELLKAVVPRLLRVAVTNQTVGGGLQSAGVFARLEQAAAVLGVQVQLVEAGVPVDVEGAFAAAMRWPADAMIVRGSLVNVRDRIADLAARNRLPAIYGYKEFVDAGGLMSYGTSLSTSHRHTATFVDKILRGTKPADLPVEQLTTIEFVVNVKTLQALGLTIPPDVAAQVTEWVQ
jgi:putative ABC transport system substrate-binding protein